MVGLAWRDGRWSQVEVKVGDPSLAKTRATGAAMRDKYGIDAGRWSNYLLLLDQQLPDWNAHGEEPGQEPETLALTWEHVAVGLRVGLRSEESLMWKAFALAYLGAVEQMIVGFPGHRIQDRPLEGLAHKLLILKEGLADE